MHNDKNILFCSFYTDDDYYRAHGESLKKNLNDLGLDHEIREIKRADDEDWIDICRQKVPFLDDVCKANPEKRIFWIDVDCRLIEIPDLVLNSSADILGFQRGFSSAMTIGYAKRARFWEPCFWGVGTSSTARKMISDAAKAEATMPIKATDDYFFEEGWRANADSLTFQIIPSSCVVGKQINTNSHPAFFMFGSSGNVSLNKENASQHEKNTPIRNRDSIIRNLLIKIGRLLTGALPKKLSIKLISFSDRIGMTHFLLGRDEFITTATQPAFGSSIRQRTALLQGLIKQSKSGDSDQFKLIADQLRQQTILTQEEKATIEAGKSFLAYSNSNIGNTAETKKDFSIYLSWWARPFPGNFGDWLSPMIYKHYLEDNVKILHLPLTNSTKKSPDHIVSVGSVGRFIKENSIVVGTGISSQDHPLNADATYISVRGPITAKFLQDGGGPKVESFGDPAALLSRVLPLKRESTNGRIALVRHFTHIGIPLELPANFDELSVLVSSPDSIKTFVKTLINYDLVVTSAMHVLIVCQSYGIPCSLITFQELQDSVHGTGIKYTDYALGVGLDKIEPTPITRNLSEVDFESLSRSDSIPENKKEEIEACILESIEILNKSSR